MARALRLAAWGPFRLCVPGGIMPGHDIQRRLAGKVFRPCIASAAMAAAASVIQSRCPL